ncbi:DUF4268 domain-containing protein [Gudongella sp. DL1XJH-153]|uniref:DUF4268 domain-containing protein n=1 Tax=Gudongella sp. DL1XJH-153 TaxID=3409804 RepID=UPI003BB74CD5
MLGKIEKVDLRTIWKHEALDFTTWLAREENIELLSNEIGIEMQVAGTEVSVGSFSVDILAENINDGSKIIIENQLEQTNHDHLGKLITYASGLDASNIIWVFKYIREEHRRAIDWLNEITNSDVNFFAIQVELWKIGESLPAPKFKIISSPNDWAKAVRSSVNKGELNESGLFQLEFWEGFSNFMTGKTSSFKLGQYHARHWYNSNIGVNHIRLAFVVSVKYNFIRCEIYIPDNKDLYYKLYDNKDSIETELGFNLEWEELPHAKGSRISIKKEIDDLESKYEIANAYKWYYEIGEMMGEVFNKYGLF